MQKDYKHFIAMEFMMNDTCFLTVFTPAYNRAHTLPRTYESLCKQDYKNFIWLIVDDGSTDKTKELVQEWQKRENGFEIEYIYKENGGMHTAHNTAYANINTELNVCIDSDDCLADGAGKVIGKGFSDNMKETTLTGYYANGGYGDKKLVYRTDVIKKYPSYPVFPGEKYVALAYKYRLIDQDYKLAILNEVLCNVEYQDDGSSATMWKQYVNRLLFKM